jgi:(p)ppGpp synthase/HD superfamily hydrolase
MVNEAHIIRVAVDIVNTQLSGQQMRSGGPATKHAMNVAEMIASLGLPPRYVAAALIHDTVEDSRLGFTLQDLERAFDEENGPEIAFLVGALTKTNGMSECDYFVQIFRAACQNPIVLLFKLCDRLDGLRWPYDRPDALNLTERASNYYMEALQFVSLYRQHRHLVPVRLLAVCDQLASDIEILANQLLAELVTLVA